METKNKTCEQFVNELASSAPAPGGGGAAALCGAIGVSLGNMVGELTVGKKKYADVEEEMKALMAECTELKEEFLGLVDEDAECFEPLMAAYALPKGTPEEIQAREAAIEENLNVACSSPLKIMKACCRAIDVIVKFAERGSLAVISDAGCGMAMCRAALEAASLNIFINTKAMKDRAQAEEINAKANEMLFIYSNKAENIVAMVTSELRSRK